jgi:hypothetical protein
MENKNESVEVKTKNITFGLVVAWILGVLFAIVGLTSFSTSVVSGILFLVMAFITLPVTDDIIKNKLKISLSKGLKIFLIIVLLAIAGSLASKNSPTQTPSTSNNAPVENVQKTPELTVTAIKLSEDYKANEVSADAKYKGKFIEVSGVIDNIAKDIMDTPYVTLKTDTYSIVGVQCMFEKESEPQLATLSKGKSITLQGEVSGKMMNVIIRGCIIK